MRQTIQFKECRIERDGQHGVVTIFNDGAKWGAYAHQESHYYVIAHRCGYGDDIDRYCFEHEVAHAFLAEEGYAMGNVIKWLAHGWEPMQKRATLEEAFVQMFQRWARANERPIIGNVDWDDLKARFIALLYDPI